MTWASSCSMTQAKIDSMPRAVHPILCESPREMIGINSIQQLTSKKIQCTPTGIPLMRKSLTAFLIWRLFDTKLSFRGQVAYDDGWFI
ncbi:hypothetical protein BW716_14110 [[Flexibacter] sp. ATCC 35208]|nr:hypothetical protein BW716_14110 [[Flexibacter] sp. ATCC 35208]